MLETLDVPALASALGQRLRSAGVPVTPERSAHFARALALVTPVTRPELYWTARAVFVSSQAQLATFDRVFAAVFDRRLELDEDRGDPYSPPPGASQATERPPSPPARSLPREPGSPESIPTSATSSAPGAEDAREVEVPLAMASEDERLAEKSFAALEPHELAALHRLMARMELATPQRRSRRARRARRGERLDLRATLRESLRTGGDPVHLARRRRRERPRRLVLLCDISGSMEPYARAYLQLMRSAVAGGTPAEAFVFATRLTRLTRALSGRNAEAAIQRAAAAAPDWSSGTRIGQALKTFNDRHGRRGMARGAVVVILSDGWERADPALVAREMGRLARLAYRIVWVNPRVSASGFAPGAGGMAAALPYCDALVSGHSLKALDELAEAIAATAGASPQARWKALPVIETVEPSWPSAEPTDAQKPVAMPSGYGPSRGNTTA
ncbi:MAG: VWA domain-containing protein [Actinomycetota bacterium]|nr:VWA domain-containing protein [Actinomycetota bacterium]